MKEYNLEFSVYYINTDNFKQKNAEILISTFANSRIHEHLSFAGYANIEFSDDDRKHRYPHITELEKFARSKTNCLVFNMHKSGHNDKFDKCFIYRSNNHREPTYGYVFYNTETGEMNHVWGVTEAYDALCIRITQTLNLMINTPLYDFYSKKFDAAKERNGLTKKDIPNLGDYNKMLEELEQRKNWRSA